MTGSMTRREAFRAAAGALLATYITPARRSAIDLAVFCARYAGSRYDFTTPYHLNDWTYASDRRVCVRVAPLVADRATHAGAVPKFDALSWNHDRLRGWQTLPDLTPIPAADSDCPVCDGYGSLAGCGSECAACEGYGGVYIDSYSERRSDCRACDGTGTIPAGPPCPSCKGKAIGVFPSMVNLGGVYYDATLYGKVRALAAEAVPDNWNCMKSFPLMKFRFAGGDGLLMGLDQGIAEKRIAEANANA